MQSFATIWDRAVERHGEEDLRSRFLTPRSADQLRATGDDRYLSSMTSRVFAAGFRWRVIQAKWDGFEEAFAGFDPSTVAAFEAEDVERLAQDTRIVRNRPKILSTIANAAFVRDTAAQHGSFGDWLADWPADDVTGLWAALKKGGHRLGGETGPWFLRMVGYDTFRFSSDVGTALVEAGVLPKPPNGKRATATAQAAFNAWAAESGLPLSQISVVLACSAGEVHAPYGR